MLTAIHWLLEVSKVIGSAFPAVYDSVTVGVEAENLFLSFIAQPVMSFVVVLHY
jgi:hypothetical protein